MACWTLFVLTVAAFYQVSDAIIGENSITCVTFDAPLFNWFGDPIGSNGVYLNNYGVEVEKGKGDGLDGTDCGEFKLPSKLEIPFLRGNDFSEFAVSIWFRRSGEGVNPMPVVASNGDCANPTIEIMSTGATGLSVKISSTSAEYFNDAISTNDQMGDEFVHVVVTARMSRVNGWGWVKVYTDGVQQDVGFLNGRLPGTFFPMMIGANKCMTPPPTPPLGGHFFEGTMDSISFARYYLSTVEVEELYASKGACIGE
ncbi:hypothetical protein LSAT2_010050 [Lamellibrachia satsuma]|nr:hypothetical protein LSAT2_010050 [Lamellibrachia satsuma]